MLSLLSPHQRFFVMAVLFEGGLGVLAAVLGHFLGYPPLATTLRHLADVNETLFAVTVGLTATVPLVAGLLALDRCPWRPVRDLKELVELHLVPLFSPYSALQLAVLSVAAGIGEEMLFRGLLQVGLTQGIGAPFGSAVGLAVGSLVFGMCHWLTASYAFLAALVGVYLGGILLFTDNLLAPMVAHAAYDFIALAYLVRRPRRD